jgi:hypothetical protein
MDDDDALEVIRQAERVVWAASWHLQEQSALEKLAGNARPHAHAVAWERRRRMDAGGSICPAVGPAVSARRRSCRVELPDGRWVLLLVCRRRDGMTAPVSRPAAQGADRAWR